MLHDDGVNFLIGAGLGDRALEDLERLAAFLEEASHGGDASLDDILRAVDILSTHPLVGRRVTATYRELVISRGSTGYMALYVFEAARDLVRILRSRHQREAGYID